MAIRLDNFTPLAPVRTAPTGPGNSRRSTIGHRARGLGLPLLRFTSDFSQDMLDGVVPMPGWQDVLLHGMAPLRSTSLVFQGYDDTDEGTSRWYSARELAQAIRARREYEGGPIRLLACHGAAVGEDQLAPAAQQLADAMGVPVMGNLDLGWFSPSTTGKFGTLGGPPVGPIVRHALTGDAEGYDPQWIDSRRRIDWSATEAGYRTGPSATRIFYPSRGPRPAGSR